MIAPLRWITTAVVPAPTGLGASFETEAPTPVVAFLQQRLALHIPGMGEDEYQWCDNGSVPEIRVVAAVLGPDGHLVPAVDDEAFVSAFDPEYDHNINDEEYLS